MKLKFKSITNLITKFTPLALFAALGLCASAPLSAAGDSLDNYTRVEYLHSSGSTEAPGPYIQISGFNLSGANVVETKFAFDKTVAGNTWTANETIFCNRHLKTNNNATFSLFRISKDGHGLRFDYRTTSVGGGNNTEVCKDDQPHTIVCSSAGLTVDGTDVPNPGMESSYTKRIESQGLILFACDNYQKADGIPTSNFTAGKLYYFRVMNSTSDSTLCLDLVPVRNREKKLGLYDTVNNHFYPVTGDFEAGPNVGLYTPISYIKTTRYQSAIDTGYYPNPKTWMEVSLKFDGEFQTLKTGNQRPAGTTGSFFGTLADSNHSTYSANFGGEANQYNEVFVWAEKDSNGGATTAKSWHFNLDNTVKKQNTITFCNGSSKGSFNWGGETLETLTKTTTCTNPLYILGAGTSSGPQAFGDYEMYVYSWKIYESNDGQKGGPNQVLKHDYIPVKNSSDVPGLYDLVTGEFYSSTSGTNFEPGDEVVPSTLTFLQRLALDSRRVSADADTRRAEGGDIVLKDGDDYIHIFTKVGEQSFTVKQPCSATALLVGGGGGGGNNAGGGGGGGGVTAVLEPNALTPGSLEVIVGAGGAAALNSTVQGTAGGTSTIGDLVLALGGNGGYGFSCGSNSYKGGAAGDGGGKGGNAVENNVGQNGTQGNVVSTILGSSQRFGGGGGGGAYGVGRTRSSGGDGGGGSGSAPTGGGAPTEYKAEPGENGLGGGGGGGAGAIDAVTTDKGLFLAGGRGGDGIVIIRVSAPLVTPVERPTHAWNDQSRDYSGEDQKPTYEPNDGYTITYYSPGSWVDVGSYTVTFTLNDGYEWADGDNRQAAITHSFTIDPKTVTLNWSNLNLTYNGQPQHPTCTAGGLVSGDTCNVTLTQASSNTKVGNNYTAGAESLDNSNYQLPSSGRQQGYSINPKSLSGTVTFSQIPDQTATGSALTPSFDVTDTARGMNLTKGTDYTFKYSNNINPGTATITITGTGNYKDTATTTFTIKPAEPQVWYKVVSDAEYPNSAIFKNTGWSLDPNASEGVSSHTFAAINDYVICPGRHIRAGNTQNLTFPGNSLKLSGRIGLGGAHVYTFNNLIADGESDGRQVGPAGSQSVGGEIGAWDNNTATLAGAITVPEGRSVTFATNGDQSRKIAVSAAISGKGTIFLSGGTGSSESALTLFGDNSGFTGTIKCPSGGVAEPLNYTLKVTGNFGGTITSLPSAANTTAIKFSYAGLPDGKGLVVSSTTIPEALKTKLTLYSATANWQAAENLPLITFPSEVSVNPSEFTVKYASSESGTGTDFPVLSVFNNGDGTSTLVANPSQTSITDATVTYSLGSATYDGLKHQPEVTVTLSDGETVLPSSAYTIAWLPNADFINAGPYTPTVTAKDGSRYTGSVTPSNPFTINKATAQIEGTLTITGWTEGDPPNLPSGLLAKNDIGKVVYKYSSSLDGTYSSNVPEEAGTYWVRGEIDGSDNWDAATPSAAVSFVIQENDPDAVPLPRLVRSSFVYDGLEKTVSFVSTKGFTAVGTLSATDLGEYTITCTLDSCKHWENGSTDPVDVTWRITAEDTRTFLQKLADDPRKVTTGFESYATGGDIILKEGDEYIHVFTNSATFTANQSLTARVLLVAGGGSSGSPEYGVAGGGGAGGMVYNAAGAISQGGHSVTVGKGGVSANIATSPTSTRGNKMSKYGQNGGNSSIADTGLTAIGGGRGAENDWGDIGGALGGSGGGGGYANGAQGNGTSGQGNQGGDNDTDATYNGFMAGGGGGAGSAGHNFGNSYRWAQGGDGMNCDILGFNQVFAGGGSGYTAAMTDLPGGLGGGGSWSYEFMRGGNGENGLGGGASGANSASGMYRGGDGIVIVRYSTATLAKTVLVPEPIEGLVYTGWEQTGVPKGKGYSIVNETGFSAKATDAGHYTAKVRVDSGYTWEDGTTDDKEIEWTIEPYDLSTSHGMVFGAKDMMAMGATVTPTWNFVLNTATIGSSQWEVGDWDGSFINPGTYHGKLRPSATGTNFTGERDITFTIQAAVKTYYLVGSDGTEFSSFNGVSTKTSSTTTEPTVGWSTEPNGAVDVDHTVKANFDYVIPAGAGLRNPKNDEKTHTFKGASLEVRGGNLNLQASGQVSGDGNKWRLVDYSVAVKRFIFDGGGANDTNDGINWAVKAENGFEIRSGGAVIGLTAQNSRYITLIGDLTRYDAGGNLTVRTTHTGDNGYTRSLAIDGDWSKFAGDIVAEPVDKSPVRFYLGVAGAFGGKVQSLPPVRNVTESYIIFNYDKLRNAQRGLEVNTNNLNAVSLLKTRLWLVTSKAATTKNLPIMTFPAGTTVTPSQFTGVHVIPSYTVNTQPSAETTLSNMGTRTNDDGTITLYANFSNNIADFDVTCPSQVYTGSPLTPVVTVKLAGRTLVEETDYTIGAWTPSGLTETGNYTATITGLGDYEGTSKDVTFTIVAAGSVDLKDHITVASYDDIYDGNPHTVTITLLDEKSAGATVKFGLTEGVYDLNAAPNPTLPYDATVYYQVSKEGCTTATGSRLLRITASDNRWTKTPLIDKSTWAAGGSAGKVTDATTEYGNVRSYLQLHGTSVSNLWSYAMPDVPGTYTLYWVPEDLPGVNPPVPAVQSLTFTITGAMPGAVTAQSQVYTGEPIAAPAYTVIYTVPVKGVTRTLVKGVDFDEGTWSGPLTDGQMINAGVYTLTLTGKNPYTGSTPVSFTIEKAQNEWTQDPAITPATWSTTDAYGTLTPGKTKFGAVTATYTANYSDSTSASGDFTSLDDPAFKKAGSFTITYAAPAATANYDAPNVPSKSVAFTITQGVYTYGKYETLSAADGAYVVVKDAAIGEDDEIDKKPVDATAYANSDDDLWMFHNGTAPVAATFNHFRIIDTDGQLQHNLVPARQVESGKDGFYDTVTKAFFANASAVQGAALTAENNVTPTVARPNLTTTVRETGDEIDILEGVNAANMAGILAHGTTKATEPGTYTFALTPDDEHVWADGTFATIPYTWTITEDTREEVAKPYALDPPAQYNGGNAVNGIAYDSALLGTRYAIAGDGTSATAAGSYHSTATLLDPDSYRWQGTHESVLEIDWQIAKGANEWTTPLSLPSSWEPGQTVSFTQPIAKFGTAQASLKRPGGNTFEPWSPDFGSLTENGDYQVRFAVAEDDNWTAIEVIQDFRIKDGTMKDDIKAADVKVFYDGKAHGITVTLEGSAVGATLKFWNEATSAYDLDVSPTQTAVGVLTVKYQVSKTGKETVADSRTVTVTAKPLTVKNLAAADRDYDGKVNVTLMGTLDGVVEGDTVTLGGLTGTMADKNAGSNKTVTPGTLTLDGADAGNYTLTQPTGTLTVNIAKKSLTVTGLTATNRAYDGTTTVALTGGSLEDVISGDSVTCTMPTSGTIADANVGTGKTVSFADLTLGGADAGNYALTQPTHPTVNIEAATITAVTLAADSAEWTGKAITPTVTSVTANGKAFTDSSVGWSVSYKKGGSGVSEIVDIGEYKVVVTGTANLTDTAEATFTVTKPSSYLLSAIKLDGPKVAVDTEWLEAAFSTAEATQAGYQSAFLSTNSNGVTAWAAYILGFAGGDVDSWAIIEKTTGSTTDKGNVMLTVELPDLPETKPTVANCTVRYSLLTSANATELQNGKGDVVAGCEKRETPRFSVPAPTTGNHAYYRIRIHFIFEEE